MSFCGLVASTSSEVVTELDSSSAVVSVLGDESGTLSKSAEF